ncbi:hypothetical protein BUE80_DR007852 [Diplocarpon rosae]|nr:hypothetical protein BUE80_DR007852 [Diplocarpon rosae]
MISRNIILSSLAALLLNPLAVFAESSRGAGELSCTSATSTCVRTECVNGVPAEQMLDYCSLNCDDRRVSQYLCCEAPDNRADLFCTTGT